MKHKNFTVYIMDKTSTVPLNAATTQGGIQKSFDSKQEAMDFAKNNRKSYNKITIKCHNEDDIVYD